MNGRRIAASTIHRADEEIMLKAAVWLLLVLSAGSCLGTSEYSVAVFNGSPDTVSDADVSFRGFYFIYGWLRPGILKVNGSASSPIPDYATVRWRTADGLMHEQKVAVRSVLPRGYRGDLSFTIRPDNTVLVDYDRSRER
jgi:hypothetical protein